MTYHRHPAFARSSRITGRSTAEAMALCRRSRNLPTIGKARCRFRILARPVARKNLKTFMQIMR